METSHLICCVNQMTGFHMKCNNGMKWVNGIGDTQKFPIAKVLLICDTSRIFVILEYIVQTNILYSQFRILIGAN